jgi:hypothetical protein
MIIKPPSHGDIPLRGTEGKIYQEKKLARQIIACSIDVHRILRPWMLESA